MRIALLGGTRFIGFAAAEELAAAGHDLLFVHRGETEPAGLPAGEHLHVERMDLAGAGADLARFAPDAVVDFRATSRADTRAALAAVPAGVRLVVISSMDVYRAFGSLLAGLETDPVPLTESSPVRSERYPYRGQGHGIRTNPDYDKLDVEEEYLARGAISLRLPMTYGERDYQRREEFILRRVRAGRTRIPFGAGRWLPCRGYVRDVARAIRLAAEGAGREGGIYNLGDEKTFTVRLWAEMILAAAGFEAELVRVPEPALPEDLKATGDMVQDVMAHPGLAMSELGWRPGEPKRSLEATVRWHLANPPDHPDAGFVADEEALAAAG